jgi:hypothetical protein
VEGVVSKFRYRYRRAVDVVVVRVLVVDVSVMRGALVVALSKCRREKLKWRDVNFKSSSGDESRGCQW